MLSSTAPAAPLPGPALVEAAAGAAGDGRDGMPPGRPSQIPGPKLGGRASRGSGGKRNGPPVPSPPRCGTVPPTPPPGQADSDYGDDGASAAARSDTGNGNPLRKKDVTAVAIAGKVDDAGQENNNRSSNNGDDDEDDEKWGRGA